MPQSVCDIAWKAQLRLCNKYRALSNRKVTQVAVTAVARELIGFIWAICREMDSIKDDRLAS